MAPSPTIAVLVCALVACCGLHCPFVAAEASASVDGSSCTTGSDEGSCQASQEQGAEVEASGGLLDGFSLGSITSLFGGETVRHLAISLPRAQRTQQ